MTLLLFGTAAVGLLVGGGLLARPVARRRSRLEEARWRDTDAPLGKTTPVATPIALVVTVASVAGFVLCVGLVARTLPGDGTASDALLAAAFLGVFPTFAASLVMRPSLEVQHVDAWATIVHARSSDRPIVPRGGPTWLRRVLLVGWILCLLPTVWTLGGTSTDDEVAWHRLIATVAASFYAIAAVTAAAFRAQRTTR